MTEKSVATLVKTGEAVSAIMSRAQKLEMLARWFETKKTTRFGAIYDHASGWYPQVEHSEIAHLDTLSTKGTALGEMATALEAHGIPTGPTVGDVRRNLGLDQDDLHLLVCHCRGGEISGEMMASRLRHIANRAT